MEAAASESNYKKKRMEEFTGFLAAVGSILFFGSYAVPIRLPSVMAAKIDPVIFQFYKSFACFSTSWLVLLYMVCILQVLCLSVSLCASGLHTTTIAEFACDSCGFFSSYVIFYIMVDFKYMTW